MSHTYDDDEHFSMSHTYDDDEHFSWAIHMMMMMLMMSIFS